MRRLLAISTSSGATPPALSSLQKLSKKVENISQNRKTNKNKSNPMRMQCVPLVEGDSGAFEVLDNSNDMTKYF